jgi:hypothetical protein
LFLQTHLVAVMCFDGGISVYIIAQELDIFDKNSSAVPQIIVVSINTFYVVNKFHNIFLINTLCFRNNLKN